MIGETNSRIPSPGRLRAGKLPLTSSILQQSGGDLVLPSAVYYLCVFSGSQILYIDLSEPQLHHLFHGNKACLTYLTWFAGRLKLDHGC